MNKTTLKSIKKGLKDCKEGKITKLDIPKLQRENEERWSQWWYPSYHFFRYGVWNWFSEVKYRIPNFFHRAWYGWGKADTWNFNYYLSKVIYEGLIHLKKHKQGYPITIQPKIVNDPNKDIDYDLNEKNWDSIIDQMIYAFKLAKDIGNGEREYYLSEISEEKQKKYKCLTIDEDRKMKEGMKLFIKYFFNLWD